MRIGGIGCVGHMISGLGWFGVEWDRVGFGRAQLVWVGMGWVGSGKDRACFVQGQAVRVRTVRTVRGLCVGWAGGQVVV